MKWFYEDRVYFGAKSQSYDATMKRTVKENPLEMSVILRNKSISSKRVSEE
jgi:IS5 family transposase